MDGLSAKIYCDLPEVPEGSDAAYVMDDLANQMPAIATLQILKDTARPRRGNKRLFFPVPLAVVMHALWRDIALKVEQMARSHSSLWGWWTERLGPELQNFYGSMRPREDQVAGPVKIRSGA